MDFIAFICFYAAILFVNVLENWYREKAISPAFTGKQKDLFGTMWHTYQMAGWIVTFLTIAILIFDPWTAIKTTFVGGAFWWTIYSGYLNALKKRWWFHQSTTTTSTMEKYGTIYVKLGLIVLSLLVFFLAGCSPTVRYIDRVQVDTLTIVPPPVIKELPAQVITDTVIIGTYVKDTDTVIKIKYYPLEQKFNLKVKPDTIKILRIDTVTTTQIIETEKDEGINWYWIAIIAGIVVIIITYLKRRS
jgi:hypothetical protein